MQDFTHLVNIWRAFYKEIKALSLKIGLKMFDKSLKVVPKVISNLFNYIIPRGTEIEKKE